MHATKTQVAGSGFRNRKKGLKEGNVLAAINLRISSVLRSYKSSHPCHIPSRGGSSLPAEKQAHSQEKLLCELHQTLNAGHRDKSCNAKVIKRENEGTAHDT